jgi:hypothetical protein
MSDERSLKMDLNRSQPQSSDAFERMDGETYTEFRTLKAAGILLDPEKYLAFRERPGRTRNIKLVVSDAGIFFLDITRKINYKLNRDYLFLYHNGLHAVEEDNIRSSEEPIIVLENLLEFWKRPGVGFCLVADHLNNCGYLSPEQKTELENVQKLYKRDEFIINPMLQKKEKEPSSGSVQVLSLDD